MLSGHTVVLYACAAATVAPGVQVLMELAGSPVGPWAMVRRIWRRPVPVVATGLVALMVVMAVAQTVHPPLVGMLARDPHGGWWRPVTALLVQSSGWWQLTFNLAALIVVAPVAARVFGGAWTLVIYLVAGIAAQVVSAVGWAPYGAGNSVAICGLVGALAAGYTLRGPRRPLRILLLLVPASGVTLCLVANNHGVGLLAGCACGAILATLPATVTHHDGLSISER